MRLIYLARHGDYHHPDGGLTDAGYRQAELLGERLRDVTFAAVHHSPWQRAAETAAVVGGFLPGVPLHPSELLTECLPPLAGGEQQVAAFEPEVIAAGAVQAPAAVERFTGPAGPGPLLLISHGNLINWFVTQALDAPAGAWLRLLDYHCALTVLGYLPDRVKLICYNDMGHLPADLRGTDYPAEARI